MTKLIHPKYYTVPARSAYFRHHKGTPEMHIITEENLDKLTPDPSDDICETYRFKPNAYPLTCDCGAYFLMWA